MKRVTGIGGIFFNAKDPVALRAWYKQHLGIDVQSWGGAAFDWTERHADFDRAKRHLKEAAESARSPAQVTQLVERTADQLANVVAPPGPIADLGCGPGAHALALARRGYDVVGIDGSPRMVEVARTRAARDEVDATFDVHDVSAPFRFADASLGGVVAVLVLQHLPHPAAFVAEIRRCLRPGGHLLITAPARDGTPLTSQNLYWRLRAACYHLVPGVVRFYDTSSLPHLVEDQGLTVVECNGEPGRVCVLARA